MVTILQVIFFTGLISSIMSYPNLFDPTDLCIIACDECYKGAAAVDCANECIITQGKIGMKWTIRCLSFDAPINRLLNLEN